MGLTVSAGSGGTFVPVPPGMHLARCYRIIDIGTQRSEYLGQEKYQPKVMIQFEVHSEDDQGNPLVTSNNEPMSISKNYTASLGEQATLRKDLVLWRGRDFTPEELRGFELKNVLGAWAMITVTKALGKDGKEYTNIGGIAPVPANIKKAGLPEPVNKTGIFWIEEPDMEMFESFSDKLKKKIMESPEWKEKGQTQSKLQGAKIDLTGLDEEVPF
jgi:hypothetical protein